jgi:acyl-coenzyme A synthetase/AMP-(fatty) acid ligase
MYGFTEATARVAVRRMGDGAPPDSVGLPLPGTRVEIVSRDGTALAPGTEGFVRAHSPSLMIGYLGEPAREPGTPFTTTDLGMADVYGNVFITGRDAEMMNFHGNRLSIVSVESAVMRVPGVLDARLTPDSRQEDARCTLRVVAHPEVDPDRLRERIANAVVPRSLIREITFVAALEATRSGKPIRRH